MSYILQTTVPRSEILEALSQTLSIAVNGSRTADNLGTVANILDQVTQLASNGGVNINNDEVKYFIGHTLKHNSILGITQYICTNVFADTSCPHIST